MINFFNLASLYFENEKNGNPDNKTQVPNCGLLLNTRRYAMANSCKAMNFCAMFGHELTVHQLVERAQWFAVKDGYMQSHYQAMICPFDSAKLAEGNLVTNRENFSGHTLQSADKFISVIDLHASGNVFPRSFGRGRGRRPSLTRPGMIGSSAVMAELGSILKEMKGTKRDCQGTKFFSRFPLRKRRWPCAALMSWKLHLLKTHTCTR